MENQELNKTSKESCAGWKADDKKRIAAIFYPLCEMQKAYGRVMNTELVLKGWEALFSQRYTADQICYALQKYILEVGNDFPAPKDINDILNPQKPEITQTEFIHAKQQWALDDYSPFSKWKDTVKEYEDQTQTKRESFKIENKEIAKLASGAIKRIS